MITEEAPIITLESDIQRYLNGVVAVLLLLDQAPIHRMAKHLYTRWQLGATFVTCGNGGSAATASHFAADMTKATRHDQRKSVRAICLNDSAAVLSAWANDTTYTQALSEHLKSMGRPGDVLIAISGSGNSPNVIQAAAYAQIHNILVMALTGRDGGELVHHADIVVKVPSADLPTIEDCHMVICHMLTNELKAAIAR